MLFFFLCASFFSLPQPLPLSSTKNQKKKNFAPFLPSSSSSRTRRWDRLSLFLRALRSSYTVHPQGQPVLVLGCLCLGLCCLLHRASKRILRCPVRQPLSIPRWLPCMA